MKTNYAYHAGANCTVTFFHYFVQLTPGESRAVVMTAPTIVYPQQATIVQQDGSPLEQARYSLHICPACGNKKHLWLYKGTL